MPTNTAESLPEWRPLSSRLKDGLNLARALAALYVIGYHVENSRRYPAPVSEVMRFGQEAVILFFLLSGFVIFANESTRVGGDLRGYYLRRLRRIYPALLLSLVLAAAVAAADGVLRQRFRGGQLMATVLSVQDTRGHLKPGVISDPFLNNVPLWSLSYEVAFYAVFPAVMLAWRKNPRRTMHLVGAFSVAAFQVFIFIPNHFVLVAAYLLMWWSGAAFAWAYRTDRLELRAVSPVLGWGAGLCAVGLEATALRPWHGIDSYPVLMLRHFAFALLILVLALTPIARLWCIGAQRISVFASAVAAVSYGLYVFHYPLLINWSYARSTDGFLVAVLLLVVAALVGDRVVDQVLPKPRARPAPAVSGVGAAGEPAELR